MTLRTRLHRGWARLRFLLFDRRRHDRFVIEEVAGRSFVVCPGVFNPALLRTGTFFAEALDGRLVPAGSRVLELGTGSGAVAITSADQASQVVAVDINEAAVRCARANVVLHGADDRVDVRLGDLYEPVAGERFDVVLFNPPFLPGAPSSPLQRAFHADDVLERFAVGLGDHLEPGGHALVVVSSRGLGGDLLADLEARGFAARQVARHDLGYEEIALVRLDTRR